MARMGESFGFRVQCSGFGLLREDALFCGLRFNGLKFFQTGNTLFFLKTLKPLNLKPGYFSLRTKTRNPEH
jgi:hypothetical protein